MDELEEALFHASEAVDMESLKALARQERSRSKMIERYLVAILKKNGPVELSADDMEIDDSGFRIQVADSGRIVSAG